MNRPDRSGWQGMWTAWLVAALALLIGAAPASAQPRRHALLVGIGDYRHVGDLQGPPHDVRSLERVLRRDWGFHRITTLVDGEATRAAMLQALDDLAVDSTAGDHVFIYFSGHGTSFRNRGGSAIGARLDPATGGLYPADLDPRSPYAFEQLVVGSRDLRPRLLRLDRGRNLFVVFDACFSGNTVKSITCGRPRFQPWESEAGEEAFGAQTADEGPYPYENLVYLSASAAYQVACDIREQDLWRTPTVDGRPHGALTNALLRGLAGAANTDGNGELTIRELHAYVRRSLEDRFPQTPQLLHARNRADAPDRPVFDLPRAARPAAASTAPAAAGMRVWLGPGADVLRNRLAAIEGVTIAAGRHDLRIDADAGRSTFTVRHGSGDALAAGIGADAAVRRVARHRAVHALLKESFPGQDFNVRVEMLERDGRGAFAPPAGADLVVGGRYEMRYESDVPAYFLLATVDVHGVMRLLVPWSADDLRAGRGGRIPGIEVQAPAGAEFVKLFGFRRRPPGFEDWLPVAGANSAREVRVIESASEVDALLRFVRGASGVGAETSRKFISRRPRSADAASP